jgi:Phage terminase, small subunit
MPLSKDPRRRRRQLANLRNAPPAPKGNQRARKHGGASPVESAQLEAKAHEVYDALAAQAPVRDARGDLPAYDTAAVRLLAETLCRLESVRGWLDRYGTFDEKTKAPRPAVDLESKLRREAHDYLDALGMTPRSRAKLGVDLGRMATLDLAQAMSALADEEDSSA